MTNWKVSHPRRVKDEEWLQNSKKEEEEEEEEGVEETKTQMT